MIIKSTTWKARKNKKPEFARLMQYLDHDKGESFELFQNFSNPSKQSAMKELYHNDNFRKQRANGVALYHEILSFSDKDKQNISLDALRDISLQYMKLRSPRGLVYSKAHFEADNPHIHFLISANELGTPESRSSKSTRVSKSSFRNIQKQIEEYSISKYPEISHSTVQNRENFPRTKNNQIEKQTKLRSKASLKKERLSKLVRSAVTQSYDMEDFKNLLKLEDVQVYERNLKSVGVVYESRKFRFSTLSVEKEEISRLQKQTELLQKRMEEIQKTRNINNQKNMEREL